MNVDALAPLARLLVRAERQLMVTMAELSTSTKEGVAAHLTDLASTLFFMRGNLMRTSAASELATVAESERAS